MSRGSDLYLKSVEVRDAKDSITAKKIFENILEKCELAANEGDTSCTYSDVKLDSNLVFDKVKELLSAEDITIGEFESNEWAREPTAYNISFA